MGSKLGGIVSPCKCKVFEKDLALKVGWLAMHIQWSYSLPVEDYEKYYGKLDQLSRV